MTNASHGDELTSRRYVNKFNKIQVNRKSDMLHVDVISSELLLSLSLHIWSRDKNADKKTLKCILLNWKCIQISLKFVYINLNPALVQMVAWGWACDKPISEPMMA